MNTGRDEHLLRANLQCHPMYYHPGDVILIYTDNPTTL